jgi:hypothetical protein
MEKSHRDLEGRGEDRLDMIALCTNNHAVILSRVDGEGSQDFSEREPHPEWFERFLAPLGMTILLLWH